MGTFSKKLQKVDDIFAKIEMFFVIICGIATIGLTLLVVVDVAMRNLFNAPIPGGVEATELILPYIVFLAMAYTLHTGGHVRVNILYDRFPKPLKNSAEGLDCIIGFAFFGLLTWFGALHFWESFRILEFMMAAIKLPWWVGKFSMPLGTLAITLRFALRFLHVIVGDNISAAESINV